jgi:hypothetical protein
MNAAVLLVLELSGSVLAIDGVQLSPDKRKIGPGRDKICPKGAAPVCQPFPRLLGSTGIFVDIAADPQSEPWVEIHTVLSLESPKLMPVSRAIIGPCD